MKWIIENKEWLFSGVGIAIISALFNCFIGAKWKSKYKLNYKFVINLILAFVAASIIDYKLNINKEIRFSIMIYLITIVSVFALIIIFENVLNCIKRKIKTAIAVSKLTDDDCRYVLQCNDAEQYFKLGWTNYADFEEKWKHILYINMGRRALINGRYIIHVNKYALKLINKRMRAEKNNET